MKKWIDKDVSLKKGDWHYHQTLPKLVAQSSLNMDLEKEIDRTQQVQVQHHENAINCLFGHD